MFVNSVDRADQPDTAGTDRGHPVLAGIANGGLLILTLLAIISITITVVDFDRGMASMRALDLELTGVTVKSENPPDIEVTMQLQNTSSQSMTIDRVHFGLYLNGDFMGSNYEGWEPLTATGGMDQEVVFRIELRDFYQSRLDRARESGEYGWSIQGETVVLLPYRDKRISMRIAQSWRDG